MTPNQKQAHFAKGFFVGMIVASLIFFVIFKFASHDDSFEVTKEEMWEQLSSPNTSSEEGS